MEQKQKQKQDEKLYFRDKFINFIANSEKIKLYEPIVNGDIGSNLSLQLKYFYPAEVEIKIKHVFAGSYKAEIELNGLTFNSIDVGNIFKNKYLDRKSLLTRLNNKITNRVDIENQENNNNKNIFIESLIDVIENQRDYILSFYKVKEVVMNDSKKYIKNRNMESHSFFNHCLKREDSYSSIYSSYENRSELFKGLFYLMIYKNDDYIVIRVDDAEFKEESVLNIFSNISKFSVDSTISGTKFKIKNNNGIEKLSFEIKIQIKDLQLVLKDIFNF
jgi:hypothetical protein